MTRTATRTSRVAAAVAVAVLAGVVAATGVTTAAYTDRAEAVTDVFATPTTRFVPQQTYLAGTSVALQDDGTIAVWGYRGSGLSGTGVATVAQSAPISLVTLPADGHPDGARRAIRVAGASLDNYFPSDTNYTGLAALSDDGRVYTWGGNQSVHLMGRTSTVPFTQPGQVAIPGTVVDLVSSASVFIALTSTGDVYTWGYPQGRGVTGQGSLTASSAEPARILTGVHSIGSGVWNAWAIRGDTVPGDTSTGVLWWGWANGAAAYAGDPSGDNLVGTRSTPTQSAALSARTTSGCAAVGVVAGSAEDTCAIRSLTGHYYGSQAVLADGTLLTWGNYLEWGTGRADAGSSGNNTPTAVPLAAGVTASAVATSEDYVLVHGSDGLVYVWGRYSYARGPHPTTGASSATNIRPPTPMTALGRVEAVAGFGYSGAALRTDGTLVLWGGTTQGGDHNTHLVVRDGFATNSVPATPARGLTTLVMPGTEAAQA